MVANDPTERPGSADFIANKLRDLQQQIDALTRQTKFPFSIGHSGVADFEILPDPDDPGGGAKVRILNGAGQPIFETYYSTIYNGKAARMLDLAGTTMWSLDESAGYGLSNPGMSIVMGGQARWSFAGSTTVDTAQVVADGYGGAFNPALWVGAELNLENSTLASTFNLWVEVLLAGSVIASSSTDVQSVAANTTSIRSISKMLLLPQSAMQKTIEVRIRMWNSTGGNAFSQAFPRQCQGISKAFYDVNPAYH
ncbi:hypothetical protein [Amycolatopsis echigonensis]|uniref:Uncharacterized protein n=1 Tax=Amycolatopsis echigonensis TaxID=2576905 RepID=A0A8E1W610_9PSEU|nr:hypothetical protein [Amycolatopsis echigonensis]MBB2504328.1 hypothetical protein [Amycolatopsis echigonensis]